MNATTVLSKSGLTALDDLRTEKLHAWHRERLALVYVRQSTVQQDYLFNLSTLGRGLFTQLSAWCLEMTPFERKCMVYKC